MRLQELASASRCVALAVIVALSLAGCAPASPAPPSSSAAANKPAAAVSPASQAAASDKPAAPVSPAAQAAAARTGGTLTVAQPSDPAMLAINAAGIETYNVTHHIFDSLFRFDGNAKPVPGLAESWSTSPDGLVWTFKLRRGVKFHNGEDFTSEAIRYSIEKLKDPQASRRVFLTAVTEVRTPDDYTVEIVTNRPAPSLPIYIAQIVDIYPPKYMEQVGNEEFNRRPVGTGPYKFGEWVRDQRVVLEANESYWGGRPAYDRLVFRFIPEPSTRVAELLAGNVDVISYPPIQQISQIESSGTATAPSSKGTQIYHVLLRTDRKPLDDKRVRQALNYAVDVEAIIRQLYAGRGTRIAGPIPQHAVGYDPDLKPYAFDPDRAKQLLAEAGYASGLSFKLDIGTPSQAEGKQLGEAIAGFWRRVGVEAEPVPMEYATYVQTQNNKQLDDAALTVWSGPTFDADVIYGPRIFSRVPASYYSNPELDQLITDAGGTLDEAKRKELYKQANQLFADEAGWVFLFVPFYNFGVANKVNWTPRADGNLYMIDARPK
jgi:peptide/nickel transport system substrate-binding protein